MAPKSLVVTALLILVSAAAQMPRGTEAAVGSTGVPSNVLISGIVRCNDGSSADISAVPGKNDFEYIY